MERKKASKIVLFLILILLIILGITAYAYIATDTFKTPEELFGKYFSQNIEQLKNYNYKPFDEVLERLYKENSEIKFAFDVKDEETNMGALASFNIKSDIQNKKGMFSVDSKLNDVYFFGFDTVISNEVFGLHMQELGENYIAIENRDLKKLAENLNLDELDKDEFDKLPDKITDELEFSEEDKQKAKALYQKYGNKILEQIDESCYSIEKSVQVTVNGENTIANKYQLKMETRKLCEILIRVAKELLEDSDFKSLYTDEYTLEIIKGEIEHREEHLKDSTLDNKEVVLAVYEADKKTIKTELLSNDYIFEFAVKGNTIYNSTYTPKDNRENQVGQKEIITISNNYENDSGDLEIAYKLEYNKEDIKGLQKENSENSYGDYISDLYEDSSIGIKLKTTKNTDGISSKISLSGKDFDAVSSAGKISMDIKFIQDLDIPELTEENSTILNDFTQEDFGEFLLQLEGNLEKFVEENPNTLIATIMSGNMINPAIPDNSDVSTENEANLGDDNTVVPAPDFNNSSTSDLNSNTSNSLFNIEMKKSTVKSEITNALETTLSNYHKALEDNENEDITPYLTLETIQGLCNSDMQIEFVDGTTLKCILEDDVFFAKINIDGIDWKLTDLTVLYSEDGTLEGAE